LSGRAFQVAGPACENARSPNFVRSGAVVESSPSMSWKMRCNAMLADCRCVLTAGALTYLTRCTQPVSYREVIPMLIFIVNVKNYFTPC